MNSCPIRRAAIDVGFDDPNTNLQAGVSDGSGGDDPDMSMACSANGAIDAADLNIHRRAYREFGRYSCCPGAGTGTGINAAVKIKMRSIVLVAGILVYAGHIFRNIILIIWIAGIVVVMITN